jgi:ABC-type tungstate transport system permease subunit
LPIDAAPWQVPWANNLSTWYDEDSVFPIQALQAASNRSEYTLTDRGTWLSSTNETTSQLTIFKKGSDNATDLLLNPAHVLIAKEANLLDAEIGKAFAEWVVLYDPKNKDGGQYVAATYTGNGTQILYTRAPTK